MSSYTIFIAGGIAVGFAVMLPEARRSGLSVARLLVIHTAVAAAGVIGGVVYNLVEAGSLEQFGWQAFAHGGARYPGGLLGVAASLPLVWLLLPARVSLAAFLDLLGPSTAVAMGVVRAGCWARGCCYGIPTSLPWGVAFPPNSVAARDHVLEGLIEPGQASLAVHPLQIYFGATSLAVGIFLIWFRRRKRYDGQVFLLFLALHEGAKGLLEMLRGSTGAHSVVHLRAFALTIAAVAVILLVRRQVWTARAA